MPVDDKGGAQSAARLVQPAQQRAMLLALTGNIGICFRARSAAAGDFWNRRLVRFRQVSVVSCKQGVQHVEGHAAEVRILSGTELFQLGRPVAEPFRRVRYQARGIGESGFELSDPTFEMRHGSRPCSTVG